jgi:hypothetical protein
MSLAPQQESVTPERGVVYEHARNDELYQVCYADAQIVVLRCETTSSGTNHHRLEPRGAFDQSVERDFFTPRPESELDLISDSGGPEVEWRQVDHIGAVTEENLYTAGYRTAADLRGASDEELLDVDGVGAAGLERLRAFTA